MEKRDQVRARARLGDRGVGVIAFLVAMGIAGPARAQDEITYAEVTPGRDCGIYAAGVAVALSQNRQVNFQELKSSMHTDDNGHASLLDVARCLEAHGVSVQVSEAVENPPSSSCIVALKGDKKGDVNHFVAIRPAPDGRFIVYSPPYWARVQDWEEIRPRVVGKMLAYGGRGPLSWWRVIVVGLGMGVLLGCAVRRFRVASVGFAGLVVAVLTTAGCSAEAGAPELEVVGGARQDVGSADLTGGFQIAVRNRTNKDFTVERTATSCGCGFVGLEEEFVFKAGRTSRFNVAISLKAGESRAVDFSVDLKERERPLRFTLVARGPQASGIEWKQERDLGAVRVGRPKKVVLRVVLGPKFEALAGPTKEIPAPRWVVSDPGSIHVVATSPKAATKWTAGMELSAQLAVQCAYPGKRHARVEAICGNLVVPFRLTWECDAAVQFRPSVVLLKTTKAGLVGEARMKWKWNRHRIESVRSSDPSVVATIDRDGEDRVLRFKAPESWGKSASPRADITVRLVDTAGQPEESVVTVVYVR